MIVRKRGVGCDGRGSVGRARCGRRAVFRERAPARGRTALFAFAKISAGPAHGPLEIFGARCCGRRSRVVLASVADAKPAEARSPNRV